MNYNRTVTIGRFCRIVKGIESWMERPYFGVDSFDETAMEQIEAAGELELPDWELVTIFPPEASEHWVELWQENVEEIK